jgi:hypothetical protein
VARFSRHKLKWLARALLAAASLTLALVIAIPVIIVVGLSYYVRAAAMALVDLIRRLLGHKPPPETAPVRSPHLFEAGTPAEKREPKSSHD